MNVTVPLHLMQRACKQRKKIWIVAGEESVRIKPNFFSLWFGKTKVCFFPTHTNIMGTFDNIMMPSCGDGK